ncbi:MAG: hypothetical protein K1V77_08760, partial [Muribaculaceae bacterium]
MNIRKDTPSQHYRAIGVFAENHFLAVQSYHFFPRAENAIVYSLSPYSQQASAKLRNHRIELFKRRGKID